MYLPVDIGILCAMMTITIVTIKNNYYYYDLRFNCHRTENAALDIKRKILQSRSECYSKMNMCLSTHNFTFLMILNYK